MNSNRRSSRVTVAASARVRARRKLLATALAACSLIGCRGPVQRFEAWRDTADQSYYQEYITRVEYPEVQTCPQPGFASTPMPLSIQNPAELPVWELSLQEVLNTALSTSDVLRDLGGTVVNSAQAVPTVFEPSLTDTNPLVGVEAALSEFDAQVSTQLFWQKNNLPNNQFFAGLFPPSLQQTAATWNHELSKVSATGGRYALRSNVFYDRNNNPARRFPSAFTGFIEAEWRQPLMQGSGVMFNRIAGPDSAIGQYNGVLIARINTDVSLTDFERGVINLIRDVETAYWELYFSYRNLDAQLLGRDSSLRTWQRINELQKVGARGGEADAEAQARSQFYLFETQVTEALTGAQGLYAAEQRLRYMMGMPPTDGRLIKPLDRPIQAEVDFDWYSAVGDALVHRVEVRRQRWLIKRREYELLASRLNRRARLDAVTQYRWRGLGDHLISGRNPNDEFESLAQNITEGNFQEWQAGFEWRYAIGLRRASSAVAFAQLSLARETNVLQEIELRVLHDLSNASRLIDRAYVQVQNNYNRVAADEQQVEVLRNRYERGLININFLLQAQQQLSASTAAYYRALTDYTLAIRDFHLQKGSLLAYNQVALSESGFTPAAYRDAYERGRHFTPRDPGAEVLVEPSPVSRGGYNPSAVGSERVLAVPVSPVETLPPIDASGGPALAEPLPMRNPPEPAPGVGAAPPPNPANP